MAYNPHLSSSAPGELDPDAVASRVFAEARRGGYEPTEVQGYLQVVAEEVRAGREREHELRLQIADLERQLLDTEERATTAESRRRSAEASSAASALTTDTLGGLARESGLSLQALDEVQLTILVGEETAKVLAAARSAASEIRANAERTAAEMHRKATASADDVVARADEVLDQRAREAEAELVRRLDETDAAIGLANAEAGEQRARLHEEAERLAAGLMESAERGLEDARGDAARLVEQAQREAGEQRARAEAEAEAVVAHAHETGQQLVDDARATRTRMLQELLNRRKRLRRQVEQLHAGRERFLTAFEVARDAMATIDDELTRSLPEARAAAEAAGQLADEIPDGPTAELQAMLGQSEPGATADGSPEPADSVFNRLRADRGPIEGDDDPASARPVPHLTVVPPADPTGEHAAIEADAPAVAEEPPAPEAHADDHDDHGGHADDAVPPGDPVIDDTLDPLLSRDAFLEELTRPVVRRMKRLLTDEQNELLDAVRRRRPLPSLDDLLAPVAEHERRYAEATVAALTKAAAAGHEFPGVLAEEMGAAGPPPSVDPFGDAPSVRDLAAALAVEVVGGLRATLEGCLAGADLLRVDPKARPVGAKGPTKAAVSAQADVVADQVRLAYREVRTRRVDDAATAAVRAAFARGLEVAEPADLARRLLNGLPAPVLAD